MLTLREAKGSETGHTHNFTVEEAIKVCIQANLPTNIERVVSEKSLTDSRVDVVFYTTKGEAILYEHMAMGKDRAEADRPHVDKTVTYPRLFEIEHPNVPVLASILACEGIKPQFKQILDNNRKEYFRRPRANGAKNTQVIKSQWTDEGVYEPVRFDDEEIIPVESKGLDYYKEFVRLYAPEWSIQREDDKKGSDAITLWHRLPELDNLYMAYIHTLKGSIKIGLHCEDRKKPIPEEGKLFLQKVSPEGFEYRNPSENKATIEASFPRNIDEKTLWEETEKLKQSVRKHLTFA